MRLLLAIALAPLALTACNGCATLPQAAPACTATFSDGSSACDEPTMAPELAGTWCRSDTLCLAVKVGPDAAHYLWTASDCLESGELSGGVEFLPGPTLDVARACFAHSLDLYSASVDRIDASHIRLFIDGTTAPVELTLVR